MPIAIAKDYEVDRALLTVGEIIGEGQFGDVHAGVFRGQGHDVPVAIKTCKVDAAMDPATAEKFLEEACKWWTLQ